MNFKRIIPILILLILLVGSSVVFATETTQSIDDINYDSLSIEENFELYDSDTDEFEDVIEYDLDDGSGDWDLDDDEFDDGSGDWDLDDVDLYFEKFYNFYLNSPRPYLIYFASQQTNDSSYESDENNTENYVENDTGDDLDEVYAICIKYSSPDSFFSNILGNQKSDNDTYQNIKSYVKNFNEKHLHEINSIITPTNKTGENNGNETIEFTYGFNNLFSLIAILLIGIIMIL